MGAAILVVIDSLGAAQVDALALSAPCECATEAVLARLARVRSLALVSPRGLEA